MGRERQQIGDGTITLRRSGNPAHEAVLSAEAIAFLADLHRAFSGRRLALLAERDALQEQLNNGVRPGFNPDTRAIRDGDWCVAPIPPDLQDRRVEITGPVDRKMVINALNSGAQVFMADFEDANSPTWENNLDGQRNLMDAVRGTISLVAKGKSYALCDRPATLVVRPRGWHLDEANMTVDGERMSASLFDFGLYFFHNAKALLARESGPYFYLPKLENHGEARLWNDVFVAAQEAMDLPQGTIKATVLIETVLAALEMEEIIYELRDHMAGLNAGRWDYIFSIIKKFQRAEGFCFPDRGLIGMTTPFMHAYSDLLVRACHKRGAHAMGGMAAFIPSRSDQEANRNAFARVREDKLREASAGFDGTWVAHPDLVPVARAVFDAALGDAPHQKHVLRDDVVPDAQRLLDFAIPNVTISEAGFRLNISVALQYIEAWLSGQGAVAIHNLMEDAATAEISRSQLWQWIHTGAALVDGRTVTPELYTAAADLELATIRAAWGEAFDARRFTPARRLLDTLVTSETFAPFLTLPAYELLD